MKILKITFYMTVLMSAIKPISAGEIFVMEPPYGQLGIFNFWQNSKVNTSDETTKDETVREQYLVNCTDKFEKPFSNLNPFALEKIEKNQERLEEVKRIENVLNRLKALKKEFLTDNCVSVTKALEALSTSSFTPDLLKPIIEYNLALVLAQFMEQNNDRSLADEASSFNERYLKIKTEIFLSVLKDKLYPEPLKNDILTYLRTLAIRNKEDKFLFKFI